MSKFHQPSTLAALGRTWVEAWNTRDVERVLTLSEPAGHSAERANALAGLSTFHANSGDPQRGLELACELLAIAQKTGVSDDVLIAGVEIAINPSSEHSWEA